MLRPGWQQALEKSLTLVLLAGLAALAYYPVVFRDEVPFATDGVLLYPPWEEARPRTLEAPHNPQAAVHAQRFYPWYRYLSEAAHQPRSLLWNPYENCGNPFLAVWRTRCLSPFSLPFFFFTPARAIQISVLLKLVIAGWCAYFAALRFGLAAPSAFAVATAFELSGPVFLWAGWPLADVMPFFPLLILVTDRLAAGRLRFWPFAAIVTTLMLVGGDPETVGASVLFAAIFLVARVLLSRGSPGCLVGRLGSLFAAVAVGIIMTAAQIIPYIEFLREAATTAPGQPDEFPGISHLILCFFPHFFDMPHPGRAGLQDGDPCFSLLHVGLLQVLLLALWFSLRPFVMAVQRRCIEAMLIASAALTGLALALGPILHRIPVVNLLHPEHYLVGNAFAVALCAAAALEEWVRLDPEECGRTLRRLLTLAPALAGAAIALMVANRTLSSPEGPSFTIQALTSGGFCLALLVLVVATLFRPSRGVAGYGLAGLTCLQLFLAYHPAATYVPHAQVFPETLFVRSLKETGARVARSDTSTPWPLTGNQVPQVNGCGVQLKRHAAFMKRTADDPLLLGRCGSPLFLLDKEDIHGSFAAVRPILRVKRVLTPGLALFEDPRGAPRAWMAFEGRRVDGFDPARARSDLPPLMETREPLPQAAGTAQATILTPETPTRVAITVESTAPGVLVLADAWYPGWKATVGGQPKQIFPVDGLFRGVRMDKGSHEAVFYYDPFSMKLGLCVSAVAAVVLLGGVLHYVLWRASQNAAGPFHFR